MEWTFVPPSALRWLRLLQEETKRDKNTTALLVGCAVGAITIAVGAVAYVANKKKDKKNRKGKALHPSMMMTPQVPQGGYEAFLLPKDSTAEYAVPDHATSSTIRQKSGRNEKSYNALLICASRYGMTFFPPSSPLYLPPSSREIAGGFLPLYLRVLWKMLSYVPRPIIVWCVLFFDRHVTNRAFLTIAARTAFFDEKLIRFIDDAKMASPDGLPPSSPLRGTSMAPMKKPSSSTTPRGGGKKPLLSPASTDIPQESLAPPPPPASLPVTSYPHQIVLLGAGYDDRFWRFKDDRSIILSSSGQHRTPLLSFFECDLLEVQQDKRECLAAMTSSTIKESTKGVNYLSADFTKPGSLTSSLLSSGFDASHPTWLLLEGVSMYLDEDVFYDLLKELHDLVVTGTTLSLDYYDVRAMWSLRGGRGEHNLPTATTTASTTIIPTTSPNVVPVQGRPLSPPSPITTFPPLTPSERRLLHRHDTTGVPFRFGLHPATLSATFTEKTKWKVIDHATPKVLAERYIKGRGIEAETCCRFFGCITLEAVED